MKAVLPAAARPFLEPHLPEELEIRWFSKHEDAMQGIIDADIAWVDQEGVDLVARTVEQAETLKWLFTMSAGVDFLDLRRLRASGALVTNGAGINATAVADYAVMGILAAAKRYDEVVRLADRCIWTTQSPGRIELEGTRALIVGMGSIGTKIARRLEAFDVAVTGVTRSGREGSLQAHEWQARLGDYDWIVLAAPSTGATRAMIGAPELGTMRSTAWLVNVARGDVIDQDALIEALNEGRIGGAFLDVVVPEPLPTDHPLWRAKNCLITMHLSGRSQTRMFRRAAALFVENLAAFGAGRPLRNLVDLEAGY